eukprot:3286350-Pyramimonas_sp.AAC.1
MGPCGERARSAWRRGVPLPQVQCVRGMLSTAPPAGGMHGTAPPSVPSGGRDGIADAAPSHAGPGTLSERRTRRTDYQEEHKHKEVRHEGEEKQHGKEDGGGGGGAPH